MTDSRTTLLRSLGLEPSQLGPAPEALNLGAGEVAQALTRVDIAAIAVGLSSLLGSVRFHEVNLGVARAAEMSLHVGSHDGLTGNVVAASSTRGLPVTQRWEHPAPERAAAHPEDANIACAAATEGDRIAFLNTDGGGVLVEATPNGLSVSAIRPRHVEAARFDARVIVFEHADEWLQQEALRHVEREGPLGPIVGVGMVSRLARPASAGAAADTVGAMLEGRLPRSVTAPIAWMRSVPGEAVRAASDMAVRSAGALERHIEGLWRTMAFVSGEDAQRLREVMVERDDLECARVMLDHVDGAEAFGASLERVDSEGTLLMRYVPVGAVPTDERIARAAEIRPDAWWAGGTEV